MNKQITAWLAAILTTACVGASILAIGGAAIFNKSSVPITNAPAEISQVSSSSSSQQAQIDQLQGLISQYQQREQQLQQNLDQANVKLAQDQRMLEQVQTLLLALEQRGLISITSDGRIFIN